MSKAGFAAFFIFGPDVIPDVNCNNRRLAILVNDYSQAVVENELLVRDIEVGKMHSRVNPHGSKRLVRNMIA
jgi:hypothetical protein